ncbi:MAG: tetratricopeptide repeat protein [Pseudomonadales bacterium]|jgi:tetratricopeptide (TPR) repeat protein|nr:tetratricopeptide repeat protein [Pseudomonadales bacterium]
MSKAPLIAAVLLALPVAAWAQEPQSDAAAAPELGVREDALEAARTAKLEQAAQIIGAGQPERAITEFLDPLIAEYETQYADSSVRVYCARTSAESLFYMMQAANAANGGDAASRDAIVIEPTWAFAYHLKAYALLETAQPDLNQALEQLQNALTCSPNNPLFWFELGHIRQLQGDWAAMLLVFTQALEFVEFASPEDTKNSERARALRGQGFALIELGRLDEAQAAFEQSLQNEPGNPTAEGELKYIEQLRAR